MYERNILHGFIRVHILHHSKEKSGIYGIGIINELKNHGYNVSPGTLYPILHNMEKNGILRSKKIIINGKIRKIYRLTKKGNVVLDKLKHFISELSKEVI
jgi:DNA-binding PadR family transcriptional regulator